MTSVRLPEKLEARLEAVAAIANRSKSAIIKEALEQHLEDLEDLYIAIQRINRPNRKLLTTAQVKENLKAHYKKQKH